MLTGDGDCALLAVRIKPRCSRTRAAGERAGRLLIEVTAPPVDDRANEAACHLVAKSLAIPERRVTVARGGRSRDKLLRIEGLSVAEVAERLHRS